MSLLTELEMVGGAGCYIDVAPSGAGKVDCANGMPHKYEAGMYVDSRGK
jgi:hypothetical protein